MKNDTTGSPCTAINRPGSWAKIPAELIAAVADGRLPANAMHVYAVLTRHANAAGHAWPTHGHLAADTGLGIATVRRQLRALARLGLVAVVGEAPTSRGPCNVYGMGHGIGITPSVDNPARVITSDHPRVITGDHQNESQWNENPHARAPEHPEPACDDPQHRGVDQQLLEHLPARIARRINRPDLLVPLLTRTRQRRSMAAIVREVTGNDWPPLDEARSVEAVLIARLRALTEKPTAPPASSTGCTACDTAPMQLLDDRAVQACAQHIGSYRQAVAA